MCPGIVWILKLGLPSLLFLAGGSSAGETAAPPNTHTPVSPPSQLSTIHLRLLRARNAAPDTVGLVPNPLLAHCTWAFTDSPSSHGCCLSSGSEAQTEVSPPCQPHISFCPNTIRGGLVGGRRSRHPWWEPVGGVASPFFPFPAIQAGLCCGRALHYTLSTSPPSCTHPSWPCPSSPDYCWN